MAAGIAGAMIGAGVTVAGIALSDRKTRKSVFKTIGSAKNKAVDLIESSKEKVENGHQKIYQTTEAAEKTVDKIKDDVEQTAKTV